MPAKYYEIFDCCMTLVTLHEQIPFDQYVQLHLQRETEETAARIPKRRFRVLAEYYPKYST